MQPMYEDQRVAMLVDVQNMYHSSKKLYNARTDFGAILHRGIGNRRLIRALAYVVCSQDPCDDEIKFFDALVNQGYEVVMKELQVFQSGSKKADWDVGMTVDAIKIAEKVDVVILVTGDSDFVPLVNYLKDAKGCRVEVISFRDSTSTQLIDAADSFVDMCKELDICLLSQKNEEKSDK